MVRNRKETAVIGFSAFSGTGKTTLLKKLIPILRAHNIRLAVIKHAHHDFEIDHPGKDSFELRKADAYQVLISSSKRKALITEFEQGQSEPCLASLIDELDHERLDLILVEGFKSEHFDKIELHRAALHKPFLFEQDKDIIALVSDGQLDDSARLPVLDINKPQDVANFILKLISQRTQDNL